ncbi:hypothetical protein K8R61_02210 [bacterium]|nr:hypothetical protein [bacterium]
MEFELILNHLDAVKFFILERQWIITSEILCIVIIFLLFFFFQKREDFGNQKDEIIINSKLFFVSEIGSAIKKILKAFKIDDAADFEYERGKISSILEKNVYNIFKIDEKPTSSLQEKLFYLENIFSKHLKIDNFDEYLTKDYIKKIISLIDEIIIFVGGSEKSVKKIEDLFNHKNGRDAFIFKLQKLTEKLEEEILKAKEASEKRS